MSLPCETCQHEAGVTVTWRADAAPVYATRVCQQGRPLPAPGEACAGHKLALRLVQWWWTPVPRDAMVVYR